MKIAAGDYKYLCSKCLVWEEDLQTLPIRFEITAVTVIIMLHVIDPAMNHYQYKNKYLHTGTHIFDLVTMDSSIL